ncbi:MAG: hypothetical protein HUJ75_04630, partial [Parasporobacterium sp.]|nr:hypothetical protein [Parasporobacterium sp.]
MNFTDFKNGALIDTVGMFTPQPVQTIPTADFYHPLVLDTGCKVQPDGSVDFGFYAPDAKKVTIAGLKGEELEME